MSSELWYTRPPLLFWGLGRNPPCHHHHGLGSLLVKSNKPF